MGLVKKWLRTDHKSDCSAAYRSAGTGQTLCPPAPYFSMTKNVSHMTKRTPNVGEMRITHGGYSWSDNSFTVWNVEQKIDNKRWQLVKMFDKKLDAKLFIKAKKEKARKR